VSAIFPWLYVTKPKIFAVEILNLKLLLVGDCPKCAASCSRVQDDPCTSWIAFATATASLRL
jgi:hypothetical protein